MDMPMCNGLSTFMGHCQELSKPKYACQACLDEVGTANILEVENATLKDRDREFLLSALSSMVDNEQFRIANKHQTVMFLILRS